MKFVFISKMIRFLIEKCPLSLIINNCCSSMTGEGGESVSSETNKNKDSER